MIPATTLMTIGLVLISIGCTKNENPDTQVGPGWTVERNGIRAQVAVPSGEPASIGTYIVTVTFPDGSPQRIDGERDGNITDIWLTDLGYDGQLDLIITITSAGSGSYGSVDLYRQEGDEFLAVLVPDLSGDERKGYMGHDHFGVMGGVLYRTFPMYTDRDTNARPTGGQARFRYSLTKGEWMRE
jgi:hypothetical protein